MNEYEAKELLLKYEIAVPPNFVVESEDMLKNMKLEYPLVAKVLSDKILHKSDVGGVITGIRSREEALKAFKKIHNKFNTPVLFEEMISDGVELIVGVLRDNSFGHAIMFGLGGIFTEIYKDVTFRVLPINRSDAEDMLRDIKGRKILEGFRGIEVNKEAIINLLLKISKMVGEENIDGMDINPVMARRDGCVVLDAKIIK